MLTLKDLWELLLLICSRKGRTRQHCIQEASFCSCKGPSHRSYIQRLCTRKGPSSHWNCSWWLAWAERALEKALERALLFCSRKGRIRRHCIQEAYSCSCKGP